MKARNRRGFFKTLFFCLSMFIDPCLHLKYQHGPGLIIDPVFVKASISGRSIISWKLPLAGYHCC